MTARLDERTLRDLIERQAITDLIYRYCRSMDRADADLGYTIWHADGTADYSEQFYQGSGHGYIDWVCDHHLKYFITHSHQVTNIIIEVDGDAAGSESYVTIALRHMDGERLLESTVRGRYVDRWSRRDGRWGIDRRVYLHDIDDVREIAGAVINETRSERDRSDFSYSVLAPTVVTP
jgi:hypothetical protein